MILNVEISHVAIGVSTVIHVGDSVSCCLFHC